MDCTLVHLLFTCYFKPELTPILFFVPDIRQVNGGFCKCIEMENVYSIGELFAFFHFFPVVSNQRNAQKTVCKKIHTSKHKIT